MELGSIRAAVRAAMPRTLTVLGELVALPTVFADRAGSAAYDRCARRIYDELVLLGFEEVNAEPLSDGSSCVVARLRCGTDAPTVLLYSHFDVQPVGEVDRWRSDPFELTERDGRLYGRGAADCKGGVVALLAAVRAVSDEVRCNIVFVCEGSEEAGGAGLERLMVSQPGRFADVDVALVLDGVNPAPGVPAIVDSMRGVAGVRVGVRTATAPLHAGTFGGAVPDANVVLTRLLASLWHDDGATVFDEPEGPTETVDAQALAEFATSNGLLPGVAVVGAGPLEDRTARRFAIAILATDLPPMVDLVPVLRPSAEAILSVRTPPGVSTAAAVERLRTHLRRHVLWGAELTCELRHLSDPFESVRGRAHALMRTALTHAFDAPVVQVRTGGTVPLCASLARAATGAEVILFGVADETSAIHSLDESIGVDDLESVIVAVAAFLLAYAEEEPMSAP